MVLPPLLENHGYRDGTQVHRGLRELEELGRPHARLVLLQGYREHARHEQGRVVRRGLRVDVEGILLREGCRAPLWQGRLPHGTHDGREAPVENSPEKVKCHTQITNGEMEKIFLK